MFYCEPCRIDKKWPESLSRSFGTCEVCDSSNSICWDRPSRTLPVPPKPVVVKDETIWVLQVQEHNDFWTDVTFGYTTDQEVNRLADEYNRLGWGNYRVIKRHTKEVIHYEP